VGKDDIPTVKNGFGVAIISTSQGVMTGEKAKRLSIGGELLCEVW
jgi:small subunit ribosomal protein S8